MEGKRSSSPSSSSSPFSSTAEDLFKQKETISSARSSSSSSGPGYFSTVIPPASAVISKDLSHSDLCWTLNKQRADARIANSRCAAAGNPSKKKDTQNRDGQPVLNVPSESMESPYFFSSVHYGGRDFYPGSSPTQTSETSGNYLTDGSSLANPHAADRGEWWQEKVHKNSNLSLKSEPTVHKLVEKKQSS